MSDLENDVQRYLTRMKLRTILGIVFASPVTLVTLIFYILPFSLMGWYKYAGWFGVDKLHNDKSPLGAAPVWVVQLDKSPTWLVNYWSKWGGHCVGTAIVVKYEPGSGKRADTILTHELHHADQMHRLGFFQPILYVMSSLCAKVAGEDAYTMNVFEMDARRVAGQIVDAQSFVQGYSSAKSQATPPASTPPKAP
jgi:hypothetical protein